MVVCFPSQLDKVNLRNCLTVQMIPGTQHMDIKVRGVAPRVKQEIKHSSQGKSQPLTSVRCDTNFFFHRAIVSKYTELKCCYPPRAIKRLAGTVQLDPLVNIEGEHSRGIHEGTSLRVPHQHKAVGGPPTACTLLRFTEEV